MKLATAAALASLCSLALPLAASAQDSIDQNVRVFVVHWDKPNGTASDVQQCDDNYYSQGEIFFPADTVDPVGTLKKACPDLNILSKDSVYSFKGPSGFRVRFDGTWGCEMTFKPKDKTNKARYTIELSDGC